MSQKNNSLPQFQALQHQYLCVTTRLGYIYYMHLESDTSNIIWHTYVLQSNCTPQSSTASTACPWWKTDQRHQIQQHKWALEVHNATCQGFTWERHQTWRRGGGMTMLRMWGWEHAEMFEIPLKLFLVTFIVVRSIALCPGIP